MSSAVTCRGASRRPLTLSKASGPFTVKLQGKSPPHRRWSVSKGSRIRKGLVDGQASLSTPREDSGFTVRKEPGNGRLGSPSGLCCGAPGPAVYGQGVLPPGAAGVKWELRGLEGPREPHRAISGVHMAPGPGLSAQEGSRRCQRLKRGNRGRRQGIGWGGSQKSQEGPPAAPPTLTPPPQC